MPNKKFLSDGVFLLSAQMVARLLAFSVTFVVAQLVGLEELALLGLAQSLIAFATVAGDAGLGTSAVQRIASGENPEHVVRQTARIQIVISLAAALVVVPITAAQTSLPLALSISLIPVIVAATANYVLQARLDARWIAISQISGSLCVCVFGLGLTFMGSPIWAIATIYPLGLLVTFFIVNHRAKVRFRDLFGRVDMRHYWEERKTYLALLVYTLLLHAYASCLLILSQDIRGGIHFEGVGLAMRISLLLVIPSVMLGSMLLPRFAAAPPSRVRLLKISAGALIFGVVVATVSAVCARWYVPLLFGDDAFPYVGVVQVISFQLPLSILSTVLLAALLAKRRFAIASAAYAIALCAQLAMGEILSPFSTATFTSAILWSEGLFIVVLGTATFFRSPQGRRTS